MQGEAPLAAGDVALVGQGWKAVQTAEQDVQATQAAEVSQPVIPTIWL